MAVSVLIMNKRRKGRNIYFWAGKYVKLALIVIVIIIIIIIIIVVIIIIIIITTP